MTMTEQITHEPGNEEAWVCVCGNKPDSEGFYPCDSSGKEIEPVTGWPGLYVCAKCGRVIDPSTLRVV